MSVIGPSERAWLWQRDGGKAIGVQFGEPSEAMLAADFLEFEEVVPASRLEGAVEIRKAAQAVVDGQGDWDKLIDAARALEGVLDRHPGGQSEGPADVQPYPTAAQVQGARDLGRELMQADRDGSGA